MPVSSAFKLKYGPWALVTGAARGLGAEFSRQIAALGVNLVLVDLLAEELSQVAEEVQRNNNVDIRTIIVDLADPEFMDRINEHTDGLEVGLLVSNAMFGPVGLFFEQAFVGVGYAGDSICSELRRYQSL